MVVFPNNDILKKCIDQIVKNCMQEYYGNSHLDVTGPGLLRNYFTDLEINNFYHYNSLYKISRNNEIILDTYSEYRNEQENFAVTKHYSTMWYNKDIYNK